MPVTVRIPEALQPLTDGQNEVAAEATTIDELFCDLDVRYPGIREWVFDGKGALRSYVSVFVNHHEVRAPELASAPVASGDFVSILPCIAGAAKSSRKIYLTFPQKLIKEPIIFRLGHEFNIVTNIRGASVSDNIGLVALEIEGDGADLDRAIEWLKNEGVQVEPLDE